MLLAYKDSALKSVQELVVSEQHILDCITRLRLHSKFSHESFPVLPLSEELEPLLRMTFSACLSHISFNTFSKVEGHLLKLQSKVLRILIHGNAHDFGQLQIASALVHTLDAPIVFLLELSTLLAQVSV